MRADFAVLLDACVLADARVSDLFLRLAEEPRLILPRWSEAILEETHRTLVHKLGWPQEIANSRRLAAMTCFPEAMIDGYEALIEHAQNHEKDRHVLAAAIFAKIEVIVTFNLRHFPESALSRWNVTAIHPQTYLITLFEQSRDTVLEKLNRMSIDAKTTLEDMLGRLRWSVPEFVERIAHDINLTVPTMEPIVWRIRQG